MQKLTTTLLAFACAMAAASASDADHAKLEFFESKIRPVLVEHCYKCHSQQSKNVRGGLLLDSKAGVAFGGESGDAVVPGQPAESLLLSALKHESYEMPPDRKLPDDVIADFEKWITDGAADPRADGKTLLRETIDLEEGRKFWCFQPITRPPIPDLKNDPWSRTPIDRFVAARHDSAGVLPVADATPRQIVRRLYFGLIGLPPSIDQMAEFTEMWNTDADQAIAKTTDLLLATPRFGERWGRHWLDVARFAESSGGGRSLMFQHAWRFRDYAIDSFNDDKPFDQLIREHIAGDLLPASSDEQFDDQVTGVGYLTLGPTNYEQQDKELLRMEVVDEQVDTIGRTFLGMTLGCARCHDHKFDPVPTSDYYAMAGIFRSTKTLTPGNVSGFVTTSLKSVEDAQPFADWQKTQKSLQSEIQQLQGRLKTTVTSSQKQISVASLSGIVIDDTQATFEGEWIQSVHLAPFVGAGYQHDQFMKQGSVQFETMLPTDGQYKVRLSHNYADSRCSDLPVVIRHGQGTTTVSIDQRQAPPDGVFAELGTFSFSADQPAIVTIDARSSGPGVVIVDAIQFLPINAESAAVDTPEAEQQQKRQQQQLAKQLANLQQQLQAWDKQKPVVPEAMSVRDQDAPADWHIHVRGGIRSLGDIVPRGFMSVASKPASPPVEIPAVQSGRLQLAEWIADESNPLTARVYVNRVWLHLMGEGLVRTPDNFGSMGQLPTHPELLDYLASTFISEDQWSTKRLIRRIVSSRVYRLSTDITDQLANADSENRLLTRGFRQRLEAEAVRDAMLQVSGQLNLTDTSGMTIHKVTQYDNGYDHDTNDKNLRSVYVPFFRNSMPEMFVVFDTVNPNLVTGRRSVSTLPTQALYLLNSPYVMQQAKFAAERFLNTQTSDPQATDMMIAQAWQTTVGRVASAEETAAVTAFLQQPGLDRVAAWTSVFQSLFASMDFRYLD